MNQQWAVMPPKERNVQLNVLLLCCLIDCCRVFMFIPRSYCVLFVSRSCSHIHLSLYLCCYYLLICQTAGSREFAAARSQVEKYQRDFWWVNAVGTKIKAPRWVNDILQWEVFSWIGRERKTKCSCSRTGSLWNASIEKWHSHIASLTMMLSGHCG